MLENFFGSKIINPTNGNPPDTRLGAELHRFSGNVVRLLTLAQQIIPGNFNYSHEIKEVFIFEFPDHNSSLEGRFSLMESLSVQASFIPNAQEQLLFASKGLTTEPALYAFRFRDGGYIASIIAANPSSLEPQGYDPISIFMLPNTIGLIERINESLERPPLRVADYRGKPPLANLKWQVIN